MNTIFTIKMHLMHLLLFACGGSLLMAQQADSTQATPNGDVLIKYFEIPPSFPGGNTELVKYLEENRQYPERAVKDSIEGIVVIQFIVNKDGSITHIKIIQNLSPETDAEAVRLIESMPNWIPAIQNGKPINMHYTIPIKFRMSTEKLLVKDHQAQFPGGENALKKYIQKSLRYPESGACIQAKVFVQFAINKDGSVSNITILRGIAPELDTEAVRVIESMPNWIPAIKNGKPIKTSYTMPVNFVSTNDKNE